MKPIVEEIKDAIEYAEDEYPIFAILKYSPTHVVVIWSDDGYTRQTFTIEEHTFPCQDHWSYKTDSHYTTGGESVECVHIDGEVCEFSLETICDVDTSDNRW